MLRSNYLTTILHGEDAGKSSLGLVGRPSVRSSQPSLPTQAVEDSSLDLYLGQIFSPKRDAAFQGMIGYPIVARSSSARVTSSLEFLSRWALSLARWQTALV